MLRTVLRAHERGAHQAAGSSAAGRGSLQRRRSPARAAPAGNGGPGQRRARDAAQGPLRQRGRRHFAALGAGLRCCFRGAARREGARGCVLGVPGGSARVRAPGGCGLGKQLRQGRLSPARFGPVRSAASLRTQWGCEEVWAHKCHLRLGGAHIKLSGAAQPLPGLPVGCHRVPTPPEGCPAEPERPARLGRGCP